MYFHVVMINVYYASAWPDWHKAQGNGMKRSTLGITRSKFKVTRSRSQVWRPGVGIIVDPFGLVLLFLSKLHVGLRDRFLVPMRDK